MGESGHVPGADAAGMDGGQVPDPDGCVPAGPVDAVEADLVELAAADQEGARLLVGTAHVIAGLLAAGLLEHAGSPTALYEALFPAVPAGPDRDRAMFTAGAVTGAAAGYRKGRSRWDPEGLADVAEQLHAAGWEAMGRLAQDASRVAPAWWQSWGGPPPADTSSADASGVAG